MKALLLSIRPEYVKKILQGEKKFEYRKRLAKKDVSFIYVYSTAPAMKVVASVHIAGHLSDSPTALWKKTKASAGISRTKFRDYFRGCKTAYAYELGEIKVFESPKTLSDIGIAVAPQSFVYIELNKTYEEESAYPCQKHRGPSRNVMPNWNANRSSCSSTKSE